MADIATLSIAVDSRDISRADGEMQKMGKTGEWLEGLIGKLVAAWAAWEVASKVKDIALLAARYETLGVVMGVVGNNAGYTRDQMEAFAQTLQKSGISMTESRNTLTVMAQAHIDLAKSQALAREAQDAAVIGNINSSEAFQRMIYGIQSGQTEILRTIGINVNFEQSYRKLGAQLGKSANDLTEIEKVQARTNAVMAKAPDIAGAYEASMGTAGKQVLSMKRYMEDLEVKAGAVFGPALKVVVDSLTDALKGSAEWFDQNAVSATQAATSFKLAADQAKGLIGDIAGLGSGTKNMLGDISLLELGAEGLALVVGGLRDMVNTLVGLTQVSFGLLSIIGRGIDEFVMKLTGIRPPAWIEKLINASGTTAVSAGWEKMKTPWGANGGVATAYSGGDDGGVAQINKEIEAHKKAGEEEQKRIKAGNEARKKAAEEEAKRLAALKASRYSGDVYTQYGREVQRLREQFEALTVSERDAFEMRLKGMDSGAGGDVSKAMRIYDDIQHLKASNELFKMQIEDRQRLMQQDASMRAYQSQAATDFMFAEVDAATRIEDENAKVSASMRMLNKLYSEGNVSERQYKDRMVELGKQVHIMTDAFGDLRDTVQDWGRKGTDAFVEFCNTGKGHFSDLVSSMLKDLERLAIQKQVMDPIFGYLAAGFSNWSSGMNWAGTSISTDSGFGAGGGDIGSLPIAPAAASYASPVQSSVVVNVNQATGATDAQATGANGAALAQIVQAQVIQTIQTQKRPGGLLSSSPR